MLGNAQVGGSAASAEPRPDIEMEELTISINLIEKWISDIKQDVDTKLWSETKIFEVLSTMAYSTMTSMGGSFRESWFRKEGRRRWIIWKVMEFGSRGQ